MVTWWWAALATARLASAAAADDAHACAAPDLERVIASTLEDGLTWDCACDTKVAHNATVLNPNLPWSETSVFFDHRLEEGRTYIAVFPAPEEADSCKCAVAHHSDWRSARGWQAHENGVAVGYETWCLGACGANCGADYKYLTDAHRDRRAGVLVHDVCQAYYNLTDRAIWAFTNRCRHVALHSLGAVAGLWWSHGQCSDGPPPQSVNLISRM